MINIIIRFLHLSQIRVKYLIQIMTRIRIKYLPLGQMIEGNYSRQNHK